MSYISSVQPHSFQSLQQLEFERQQKLDIKYQKFNSHKEEEALEFLDKGIFLIDAWDNYTKLMCAIETGQPLTEIQRLIDTGMDVNDVTASFPHRLKPVLGFAIDRGDDKITKFLLDKGANPNAHVYNRVPDENRYGFMSLLHYAVIYASPEIVQYMIDLGADVNYSLEGEDLAIKRKPLETARLLGKKVIEDMLIRAGATTERNRDALP